MKKCRNFVPFSELYRDDRAQDDRGICSRSAKFEIKNGTDCVVFAIVVPEKDCVDCQYYVDED